MRHVTYAVVVVLALWSGWAAAQPRVPKRPNAAQQTELDKLEAALRNQQRTQALSGKPKSGLSRIRNA